MLAIPAQSMRLTEATEAVVKELRKILRRAGVKTKTGQSSAMTEVSWGEWRQPQSGYFSGWLRKTKNYPNETKLLFNVFVEQSDVWDMPFDMDSVNFDSAGYVTMTPEDEAAYIEAVKRAPAALREALNV